MAAPFRRHRLRADRHSGQQAPPGHAARPYLAVGQAVHGFGYRAMPGRGFGRDGPAAVRQGVRGGKCGADFADQHQLAADIRCRDDGGDGGLCRSQPGLHRLAIHRRRRHGAGHHCRHADPGAGRGAGRHRLQPAGPAGGTGGIRRIRDVDRHEFGCANLRHPGGQPDRLRGRATCPPHEPSVPFRRGAVRLQAARCTGRV